MEASTGRDLAPFFETWIHGANIPRISFSYRPIDVNNILVKFEQLGAVAQAPITVTITYSNGETEEVIVPVTEKVVERTIPLKPKAGAVRKVEANEDHGALVEIERGS
jgi:hypothetical protein